MAKKERNERSEKKIMLDDTEIKVKSPQTSDARPEYHCARCNRLFPSQLDLSEHEKVDHAKAASSA